MSWPRVGLVFCLPIVPIPALGQGSPVPRPAAEYRALNLFATTGLMLSPTAYLQRDGELSVTGAGFSQAQSACAVLGIANRAEVGVAAFHPDTPYERGRVRVLGSAKL